MASIGRATFLFLRQQIPRNVIFKRSRPQNQTTRFITTTETGAILSKPSTVKLGLPKVLVILAPLMYLGATISKEGAAFLEENDIFIPDDDDD